MAGPFRFGGGGGGVFKAASAAAWADRARSLESSGYDVLWTADHFSPTTLAPVPALLAAAHATSRLRVACTVFDNDFRHPAALAKEIATVDMLSGGRVEFGIGAGWLKADYDAVGLTFDAPSVRVNRLSEAVLVIKGLWGESPFSYAGQHYVITNLDSQPKPLQQPRPPIFMGGGGKQLLSFAAREADIVAVDGGRNRWQALRGGGVNHEEESEEMLGTKIGWLREEAGERFDDLELAMLVWAVVITDDRRGAAERLAEQLPFASRPVDDILASPYFLIGTLDAIVDKLEEQRSRYGISYVSVFAGDTETFAPVVKRLVGK